MQVGIWIRVSTEEQAEGESPKNHEYRARMYADLKGWKVVEIYDLSGVSGKSVLDHPEAKRMMQDVATGKIKALIFSKLARLARNVKELLEISEHFQKHNANLVSLDESIDTATPAGRLLFTVIGALAQWEREEISARVSASVPVRARQGLPTGGLGPYGYMWKDKRLVINPDEALVVREIYKTFLEEKNLLRTARIITEKGYRSRKGVKFPRTTIKRILRDPVYRGVKRANYSKSKGNKKSWVLKPESEWVFYNVDPIIDEETWNTVQAVLNQIEEKYPSEPLFLGKHPFSGLVICNYCNRKMYCFAWRPRHHYYCKCCGRSIAKEELMEVFKDALKAMVIEPSKLKSNGVETTFNLRQEQLTLLKKEHKKILESTDKLFNLLEEGLIEKKEFSDRLTRLRERREQIDGEISKLQGEIDFIKISNLSRDKLLTEAQSLYSLWDFLSEEDKKRIIKELVSKIIIKDNEIEFELYYLPELVANVSEPMRLWTHLQQIPTFILVIPHILKKGRRFRSSLSK